MCFLFSLIPATFWATIGYFVLFSSTKAENGIRRFGRILAIWIFVIALFFPICGAYMALSGICPIDQMLNLFKAAARG
jgi:hypothetical protein